MIATGEEVEVGNVRVGGDLEWYDEYSNGRKNKAFNGTRSNRRSRKKDDFIMDSW